MNIGRTLFDINQSKIFFDPLPRVMKIKGKQMGHRIAQEIIKMKRQLLEQEKIFANKATDKDLISRIYKQLTQLSKIEKIGRRPKQKFFSKKTYTDGQQTHEKMLNKMLIICEMQVKTVRYHLTRSEWPS